MSVSLKTIIRYYCSSSVISFDLSKIEAGTLDLHYSNVEINDLMKDLENMCQLKLKSDVSNWNS